MEDHPNNSNINKLNKDMAARNTQARTSNHIMDNPRIPINSSMAEDLLVINLAHSIRFDQLLILPYGRVHHKAKAATLPKEVNRAILHKADKDKVATPSNRNMGNNRVDLQVILQAQHRSKYINSCC